MNIESLTIGEIAAVEKYSGKKLGEFSADNMESEVDTRMMMGLALVYAKRSGFPNATMEDIEQLTLDEITALLEKPSLHVTKRSEMAESIAASLPPVDADAAGESNGATPTTTPVSPQTLASAPPLITR
ncbi:MAG: hypothetical protein MSC45_05320 [Mobiluncus sp.]|uniref:hypothetical protein n=1 Tax=Mobiluncus sp. TaxID=47293 RepID=UPI002584C139|nr:hypothetical protein [Mobiluncus sp.]MCI6584471.1 hypothetical protein [Mobiluncus sp.]